MKVTIRKYPTWVGPYQVAEIIYFWGTEDQKYEFGEWLSETCVGKLIYRAGEGWLKYWEKRRASVRIDYYDTWSTDHTLAYIIAPMLRQLENTKHGAPYVDDRDVPVELQLREDLNEHNEAKFFARWDWIMSEMIWAFEEHASGKGPEQFYKDDKLDYAGLKQYEKRKKNAFRLFGKYYQNLWD